MKRKLVGMLWYDELRRIGLKYSVQKGSTGTHTASSYKGEKLCTCIGWFVRKKCKHIRVLDEYGMVGLEGDERMKFVDIEKIVDGKEETRKFESSLNAINELFEEEAYNSNELFAICAEPKIGKTLLCVQESVWLASQGYNVLYFDTEGGTASHIRKWLPVFKDRFRYDEKKGKIIFGCEKDIEKILEEFGIKAKIKVKGSKAEFVVDEVNYDKAGIKKVIEKNNIDFMIIDSISAPLRVFPSSPQNYPARADCTAIWLTSILKVMEECNVGTAITVHVSYNPTNPYEGLDGINIRGGIVMQYYCKRIIYIAKRGKKGLENYRKIWLVRSENIPEWSRVKAVKITDLGYFDVPDEELDKLLTDGEKKRLI